MRNIIGSLLLAGLVVLAAVPAVAQDTNPLEVLQSDASPEQKSQACIKLSVNGPVEAVPVLAALLVDEKLSHMARYALEPMPYPEAGQALRDALGKTSGRLKVGVINSLAIRKDQQAIPLLIPLLVDADADVAQATAVALGPFATDEIQKALMIVLSQPNLAPGRFNAMCDGLFQCAEARAARNQKVEAIALYKTLLELPNTQTQLRTAALRGAVLNFGVEKGMPLLTQYLQGENTDDFFSALRVARELSEQPGATAALAALLPQLPPERRVLFIDLFGENDGDAAGAALIAQAGEDPVELRVAALKALTRMHYSPALDLISNLAWTAEGPLAEASRDALAYFPGADGDAALQALLTHADPKARRVAVELVGQGGLDNPAAVLLNTAVTDADESVRVAALEGLHGYASPEEMQSLLDKVIHSTSPAEARAAERALTALGERQKQMPGGIVVQKAVYGNLPDGPSADVTEQVSRIVAEGAPTMQASNANFGDPAPGAVKKLSVEYTDNGTPISKTVAENETLKFKEGIAPAALVDAYFAAFDQAQGDTKLALMRLLGSTGSPKAFEVVRANATTGEGAMKDTALRTLCEWPTSEALPTLLELSKTSVDPALKTLALGGAVRLLGATPPGEALPQYVAFMAQASTPEEKKLVLSGIAQVHNLEALNLAFAQMHDPAVKPEAAQAAIAIARGLNQPSVEEKSFFNGADLTGWESGTNYWRVEEGAIVGQTTEPITQNEFLWSAIPVSDFYLSVDVLLEPNEANSGIQFRSKKADERGQATGYQADMGKDVWGHLYHEHGRGKLDWVGDAETMVKPGEWNHYEILAVGPAIWTALNGKIGVAFLDPEGANELSGLIAFQVHAGPPQKAQFKIRHLVHNPRIEMETLGPRDLISALRDPQQ
ncbi:MAG: DUF1080 domain-containing protein [FCB group bacterium]|jgi:HEAT repeat protein|nr:DUF1080 domain-containing protein [FCB group bacterium]